MAAVRKTTSYMIRSRPVYIYVRMVCVLGLTPVRDQAVAACAHSLSLILYPPTGYRHCSGSFGHTGRYTLR